MKKFVLMFLLLSTFGGCKTKVKNQPSYDLQTIKIDFAEANLKIPTSYSLNSLEEVKEKLLKIDVKNNFILNSIIGIENQQSIPYDAFIYLDSTKIYNNIWFIEGEYVELTKSICQLYLEQLEHDLQNSWEAQNIKYKRLENKYLSGEKAQFVKIKYKLTYNELSLYLTQYLISTNRKTFAIIVTNETKEDFESFIKKMEIRTS